MTKSTNNSIDILSLDAKDIYLANNYIRKGEEGYCIRYQNGENKGSINTRKFINSLDYSLDLIKIREVYEGIYRNRNFSFWKKKHEYSTEVINVTFKYSVKEFNKIKRMLDDGKYYCVYVRFGYRYEELLFDDCIAYDNGEIVGVVTEKSVEIQADLISVDKSFKFKDGVYIVKSSMPVVCSVDDLRRNLYREGFLCDGVKYIRFKRSSGSSRVGKCLFIDEKLYPRMHRWELCGLKVVEGQKIDLAALEAYISLTLSSIIGTIEIKPENILIIDDYESVFDDDVIETMADDGSLVTKPNRVEIKNSIWDGQSILDRSMFGEYADHGMVLLRNRFFKSCCFNGNIQKWFADNNIVDVSQLKGFTLAKDIKDVKMITTPSSIKYIKFASLEQWLDNLESIFGVVKYEKKTHYFDGRLVQVHYQLLNTLQLSYEEMEKFLEPSLDYVSKLKSDPAVLRNHIKYQYCDELKTESLVTKNDIIYKLLGINENFAKTKLYNDFKIDLTKSYVKNMKCGHILVNGNYSTLCGNPVEMLQSAIGRFCGESQIGVGNIHSTRFGYDENILGSRSPHICAGNVLIARNVENKTIDKYFNITNEIVCINSIKENILQRINGADFDSDTILITNNNTLLDVGSKNYEYFKVPTNNVTAKKKARFYTADDKADLDIKTSKNLIGEIVNLSQCLDSMYWDKLNNGCSKEELESLYCDICQLGVMSGIEIDKAKKEFSIDNYRELMKIREKYIQRDKKSRMIIPNFLGHIAKQKGYFDSEKKNYKKHDTAMDYLETIINRFQVSRKNNKAKEFCYIRDILDKDGYDERSVYWSQISRIKNLILECRNEVKSIYMDDTLEDNKKYELSIQEKHDLMDYIGKLTFNRSTMIVIMQQCDKKENSEIARMIINVLFSYPNESFFDIIKSSANPIEILCEDPAGDIDLYGFRYKKIQK